MLDMKVLIVLTLFVSLTSFYIQANNYTVGISVWSGYPESVKGFKHALAKAGLKENKNITYLYRNAGADRVQQIAIAKEFRDKKVNLVYSLTTPGTVIIKEYLPSTTPIIFSVVTYPADAGLIESLEYSGNNLVGTSNFVPLKNYINLLKTVLPHAKNVAIFRRKGEPNSKIQSVNLKRLLNRSGINVIEKAPKSIDELTVMAESVADQVDAFISTTDTLLQNGGEKALIAISLKTKIPILSSNKQGILAGSSFGPVADFYTLGEISGEMAGRVMTENTKPSSMSSRFQEPPLVLINRKSIEILQIAVPKQLTGFKYVD